MTAVNVVGWVPGFNTVAFINLLRKVAHVPMSRAHSMTTSLSRGQSIVVEIPEENVEVFRSRAKALGAIVGAG